MTKTLSDCSKDNKTAAAAAPNTCPMPPKSVSMTAKSIICSGVLGNMATLSPKRYIPTVINKHAKAMV